MRGAGRPRGVAAIAIDGPVVLSAAAAWAYWRLDTTSVAWLSGAQTRAHLTRLAGGMADWAGDDLHLIVAHRRVDPDRWAADLRTATPDPQPGWASYLLAQARRLRQYTTKEVYLGVRLGGRADHTGTFGWLARRGIDRLGMPDPCPPVTERRRWREEAERRDRAMATSPWRPRPASAEEVRWLLERALWRGIGEPPGPASPGDRWGPGDLDLLADVTIDNRRPRRLVIDQAGGTAHVATIALARFPATLNRVGWLAALDRLDGAVDVSIRMRVLGAADALAQLRRRLADAADQQRHLAEARGRTASVADTLYRAEALQLSLEANGDPVVVASTRLHLAAGDAADLDGRIAESTAVLRAAGVDAVVPAGDQLDLLLESMPGDELRVGAYRQWHDPATLAGSLVTSTTELGDTSGATTSRGEPVVPGLLLGHTIEERPHPVHLDPFGLAQLDASPVVTFTGRPGGGKTVAMLLLTLHMALGGARCVVIDPKGDARACHHLSGVDVVDLPITGTGASGLLDPYRIHRGNPRAGSVLAHSVLSMVLPAKQAADAEGVLLEVCDAVTRWAGPCMGAVAKALEAHPDPAAAGVARTIASMANMAMGALIFGAPPTEQGLTVDGLARLDRAGIQRIDVSWLHELRTSAATGQSAALGERFATTVMYLITLLVQQITQRADRSVPAAIVIDEAHMLTRTGLGRQLLVDLTRLSRSRNTAVLLASQNMSDLLDETILNNVFTQIACGVEDPAEAAQVLAALRLGDSPGARDALVALSTGEALMRDRLGRVGRIRVDPPPEVLRALTTTPPQRRRATVDGGGGASAEDAAGDGPALPAAASGSIDLARQ